MRGVLNFSGALKDARWIDSGEVVVFSAHDEFDQVVPYDRAVSNAIGTPVELWGSLEVDREAKADGIRSQLVTIEGSTQHVSYFINGPQTEDFDLVVNAGTSFLEYDICDRAASVSKLSDKVAPIIFPNPVANSILIDRSSFIPKDIRDIKGNVVISLDEAHSERVDVTSLPSGTYLLQGTDSKGTPQSYRFVKQ